MVVLLVRLSFVCIVVLLMVCFCLPCFSANDRPMIFGMNSTSTKLWGYDPNIWDPILYDKMAQAGCASARCSAGWDVIEVNQGVRDWSTIDDKVKLRLDHNIEPVILFGGTPDWALPDYCDKNMSAYPARYPPSEAKVTEFQNYVYDLVRRFRGRARFFEFWNEANGFGWYTALQSPASYNRADLYTPWMIRAYKAVKLADPTSRMSTTGIDDAGGQGAGFLGSIYNCGGQGYFDAVADHPYCGFNPFQAERLRKIRNVLNTYNDSQVDVWLTEFGYGMDETKFSTYQQWMTDYFNTLTSDEFSYVKIAHWHTANEFPTEHGFGLMWGDLTPKPPYDTFYNYPKPARPVISNIAVSGITQSTATVSYTTNMPAKGMTMYGLSDTYGSITCRETTAATNHTFNLTGLTPNKIYHFRVRAGAVDYGDSISLDQTFTTIDGPVVNITVAPTAQDMTDNSVTITWTTDIKAGGIVEYGKDFSYGSSVSQTNTSKSHTFTITGLQSGTNYQFRVTSAAAGYGTAVVEGYPFSTLTTFGPFTNGGFEQGKTAWKYWEIYPWGHDGNGDGKPDYPGHISSTINGGAFVPSPAYIEGVRRLADDVGYASAIGGAYQTSATPNGTYLVSGWMAAGCDGGGELIELRAIDGQYTSGIPGGTVIGSAAASTGWVYYAQPVTITTGFITVCTRVSQESAINIVAGHYDDIRVRLVNQGSISRMKEQPLDSAVGTVTDGVVTMIVDSKTFYMQDEDRSGGIMVQSIAAHGLREGDRASVIGVMKQSNGEAFIGDAIVTPGIFGAVLKPVYVSNSALGGGAQGIQPAVQDYRQRSSGRSLAASTGPNNIGVLVKTSGKVTYVGSGYFYINDGTDLDDGDPGIKGMKVTYTCPGSVGNYITVTGISSCFTKNGNIVRQIKPRRISDIVTLK